MKDYLQRINLDSTWIISLNGVKILVDPWLIGTETDGFKWLNRQWHVQSVIDIKEIPDFDVILITQPYDDHCHINTLKEIYKNKPVYADKRAYGKVRKYLPDADLHKVNEKTKKKINFRGIEFFISPTDKLYNGCFIKSANKSLLYLPHGIEFKEKYITYFPKPVDVVLTSASTYTLPFFLGGNVAKGISNVKEIRQHFQPKKIFTTHDEPKEGVGIVSKVAKKYYPTQEEFSKEIGSHAHIIHSHEQLEI